MKENENKIITNDEVAALLVQLYADYKLYCGSDNEEYANAVGIAIRTLDYRTFCE